MHNPAGFTLNEQRGVRVSSLVGVCVVPAVMFTSSVVCPACGGQATLIVIDEFDGADRGTRDVKLSCRQGCEPDQAAVDALTDAPGRANPVR
jgi:hypothetical protein